MPDRTNLRFPARLESPAHAPRFVSCPRRPEFVRTIEHCGRTYAFTPARTGRWLAALRRTRDPRAEGVAACLAANPRLPEPLPTVYGGAITPNAVLGEKLGAALTQGMTALV